MTNKTKTQRRKLSKRHMSFYCDNLSRNQAEVVLCLSFLFLTIMIFIICKHIHIAFKYVWQNVNKYYSQSFVILVWHSVNVFRIWSFLNGNQKIPHSLNNYKIKLSKSLKEVKSTPLTHKYMTTHLVDVDKTKLCFCFLCHRSVSCVSVWIVNSWIPLRVSLILI
jgi:hypothetical protein